MAKVTANVTLSATAYTLIASSGATFEVGSTEDVLLIAYDASLPAASIKGVPVPVGLPYGCEATTANCYAKCTLAAGVTVSVTTE